MSYYLSILENAVEFYNRGDSRSKFPCLSRVYKSYLNVFLVTENCAINMCGRILPNIAEGLNHQKYTSEDLECYWFNKVVQDNEAVTDEEINKINGQLQDMANDSKAKQDCSWLDEETCRQQTGGCPEKVWTYSVHEKVHIPYPLYLHLGVQGHQASLTMHTIKDGVPHIWIQRPKRPMRWDTIDRRITLSSLTPTSSDGGVRSNMDSYVALEGRANLCTTVAGSFYKKPTSPDDFDNIANDLLNSIQNKPEFGPAALGQTYHNYFRSSGYKGPKDTFDCTACFCFSSRVPPDYTPEPTGDPTSKYDAIPLHGVMQLLDHGRFEPTSAISLAYVLLRDRLVSASGEEGTQRVANLIRKCENISGQSLYPFPGPLSW